MHDAGSFHVISMLIVNVSRNTLGPAYREIAPRTTRLRSQTARDVTRGSTPSGITRAQARREKDYTDSGRFLFARRAGNAGRGAAGSREGGSGRRAEERSARENHLARLCTTGMIMNRRDSDKSVTTGRYCAVSDNAPFDRFLSRMIDTAIPRAEAEESDE